MTDLAYSEKVQSYIHITNYKNSSNSNFTDTNNSLSQSNKINYHYFEYEKNSYYIEERELKKFTADIKGELIRQKKFQILESSSNSKNESVYNILNRIKNGDFLRSDYVLFGTVNDISISNDSYKAQNSTLNTNTLNVSIAVDFNLINTKNQEVIAAFTAYGEGSNTKINSPTTANTPNSSLTMTEVSKTLGLDVVKQLTDQLSINLFEKIQINSNDTKNNIESNQKEEIIIYQ